MPTNLKNDNLANPANQPNSLLSEPLSKGEDSQTKPKGNVVDVAPNSTNGKWSALPWLNHKAKKPLDAKKLKTKQSIGKLISLAVITISIFVLGAGAYFGYTIWAVSDNVLGQGSDLGFWGQLGKLAGSLTNRRSPLKGEAEGRTNVLLLGRDVVGSGLTDSIIIGSYYYNEKKFVTLNIPRDFYVSPGNGVYKVNALYAYAEQNKPGSGEGALAKFLGDEFGIPIHYWASINFDGLEKVVDTLGGITVDVPNGFTDCLYPDRAMRGYIRPCPVYTTGSQQMDGARALIYARSRKGDNGEGSDFARSRRQSIVIQGIAQKAKESGILLNASKVNSYFDILGGTLKTNARIDEIVSGAGLRDEFDPKGGFLRIVWDTSNGFLCDDSSNDGAYIIVYCDGTIAGKNSNSKFRAQARNVVQNMLQQSELSALFESKVVMYGNQSNETSKAFGLFQQVGFANVSINNNYSQIRAATNSSTEKATIYIKDENLRNLFNKLDPKLAFDYTVLESTPETVIVPAAGKDADIIVWVSSQ